MGVGPAKTVTREAIYEAAKKVSNWGRLVESTMEWDAQLRLAQKRLFPGCVNPKICPSDWRRRATNRSASSVAVKILAPRCNQQGPKQQQENKTLLLPYLRSPTMTMNMPCRPGRSRTLLATSR